MPVIFRPRHNNKGRPEHPGARKGLVPMKVQVNFSDVCKYVLDFGEFPQVSEDEGSSQIKPRPGLKTGYKVLCKNSCGQLFSFCAPNRGMVHYHPYRRNYPRYNCGPLAILTDPRDAVKLAVNNPPAELWLIAYQPDDGTEFFCPGETRRRILEIATSRGFWRSTEAAASVILRRRIPLTPTNIALMKNGIAV